MARASHFSQTFVRYANGRLRDKLLFGSDYPWLTPDRGMADSEKIGIKDEVRPLVLRENAVRLFGPGQGG